MNSKFNNNFVTNWVINTVKEKYPDDIALVISHSTLRINDSEQCMSYFVPITKRGNELSRTFILNGEGFDIWGIPWERLESFAELEEYTITVLADAEILYAKNDEYAHRFKMLQEKLRANLADKTKMRICALMAYAQAKSIYLEMLFAKRSDIKLTAGYVLDYLAQSVAFSNLTYFKKAQTAQLVELEELNNMGKVPSGFYELYLSIIKEKDEAEQKRKCYNAIRIVQDFLFESSVETTEKEQNFQDLADWYAELSYTWLRLRYYAEHGDFVKVYMWGIYLQNELNNVCDDFCLEKQELMECYDHEDFNAFINRANEIEQYMRQAITAGGGVIHEYSTEEEFLNENA